VPRAILKLNRKLADNADVREMYDELADAGDDCIHFPISGDSCGASQCTKGTNHHTTCDWSRKAASVSGTAAPYTITAEGLVQSSSSGCITANSCVMGMFETTKYSALCGGDSIEAVYSASQGGDWFEVAMGLYEGTPGYNPTFIEKMIYRGSAVSNAVAKFTLPRSGDFFVRIFGASYDRTGGTVLGATLTLESEFEVVGSCSATSVTQQNANPPTPWPTPPPTTAPSRPEHGCASWCSKDSRVWSEKCGWNVCYECSECGTMPGPCKQWCFHDTRPWSTKCSYKKQCGECEPCA
jgi:hypothetical protein